MAYWYGRLTQGKTAMILAALLSTVLGAQGPVRAAGISNAKVTPELVARLQRSEPVEVIVELDGGAVDVEAESRRKARRLDHDDETILRFRSERYRRDKDDVRAGLQPRRLLELRDYPHLPMFNLRLNALDDLQALLADPRVTAVYENQTFHLNLAQSAPLIRQPETATLNQTGNGTTVVVADTGVDYTRAAFGSCSAAGVPATCKVVYAQDIAPNDGVPDADGHGSNVAGIVVGVATGTRIVALDVFDGTLTSTALLTAAIDWAIANQAAYNIVAINMSVTAGLYTTPCKALNPLRTPIVNARLAGILSVASSGNDASTHSIGLPACTPEAISVGAVYDANVGSISYTGGCSDSATAPDQVTCFSNSASFLNLLAPGALITAAGATYAGTSQAAPHVSGAVAVLRAAYPAETVDATVARMTGRGVAITDPRNGVTTPRLDLLAAVGAVNDNFGAAIPLTGNRWSVYGANIDATQEAGEPNHAGASGGKSLWWNWTAPLSGVVDLDTVGSDFDTVLAVYSGGSLSALTPVAANNDALPATTSALNFTAAAGTVYRIAVDGVSGATGAVTLNLAYRDTDGDGVIDPLDNCPAIANPTQGDLEKL